MVSLKRKTKVIISSLLIFINLALNGANVPRFRTLTMERGLLHTDVTCVTQDVNGLIWIGTNGGLQSFDGYNLQTYDYYKQTDRIRYLHDRITSLASDSCSLWIGTESGLLRFNYNQGNYDDFELSADLQVLSSTLVDKVYATEEGVLWVVTSDSMYVVKVDRKRNLLSSYGKESKVLSAKRNVHTIVKNGDYTWLCTPDILLQIKLAHGRMKIVNSYKCREISRRNEASSSLYIRDNFLYLRVSSGCARFPLNTDGSLNLSRYDFYDFHSLNTHIPQNTSGKLIVDRNNTLWCASNIGLLQISTNSGKVYADIHARQSAYTTSISSNFISTLFIDSFHNLWIGTWGKGLNYVSLSMPLFGTVYDNPSNEYSIKGTFVKAIERSSDGTLWLLTQKQGLNKYRTDEGLLMFTDFSQFLGKGNVFKALKFNKNERILYVGLINGLVAYGVKSNSMSYVIFNNEKALVKAAVDITRMEYDANGFLWVGTWRNGIYCFKEDNGALTFVKHIGLQDGLKSTCVPYLFFDKEKNEMMACTRKGLSRFILQGTDSDIKKVVSYGVDLKNSHSLSNNFLACIDKQNDSIYWVGTLGGGLNRLVIQGDTDNAYTATSYMTQDGMMSNDAEIVMVDKNENVWIGGYGIMKLDTHTGILSRFDHLDGLQGNFFKYGAGYKGKDGMMYMGGIDGLSYFYPNHVQTGNEKFQLYLSNLYIHGKRIRVGEKINGVTVLPEILDKLEKLTLHHDQNDFSIEFSALGYRLSNRIMYRYKLGGYDAEWREVPVTENKVLYSNLDYSIYDFELQYSTDNGQTWNPVSKKLQIEVLPPWWLSSWAKITYLIFTFSLVLFIFYLYVQELNMKHKISLHDMEKQKDEENHQLKLQFFMNISHEFKTPLTLILSSVERMEDEFSRTVGQVPQKIQESFNSVSRNANRLLTMITELVDFRKSDLNIADLNQQEDRIDKYVLQIVQEFSPWALRKKIEFTTSVQENVLMKFDLEKFSMVLTNLLSNAMKYTSNGGRVEVSLATGTDVALSPKYENSFQVGDTIWGEEVCILKISDTGVGISAETINKIYDRFFQIRDNSSVHLGSGIGLAIAKNMVLLHGGNIIVSSERMKGTEFIVTLPMRLKEEVQDKNNTFDVHDYLQSVHVEYNYDVESERTSVDEDKEAAGDPDKQILLLVEDNVELLSMLKEHFQLRYHVITAENGEEGLRKCTEFYPDLIISDVMMPLMDGIEMCKAIRNNLSIAYTPIILLTAKSTVENQIEGYESGADLYLPKPFSMKILELNVTRLLVQKLRMMQAKHTQEMPVDVNSEEQTEGQEPAEPEVTRKSIKSEKDKEFIESLNGFLEENISNPDLSVDMLCKHFGLGRTRLYAMVKEISGQSLGDFIRDIRLNKAAYLLKHTDMNITEIIYETGFGSNSHFSKVFKNKFGVTPSDFAK